MSTTPSFTTADPELAVGSVWGSVTTLRKPDLAGTSSSRAFVPSEYLFNSVVVRLGVLQGLLDSGGAPVSHQGRGRIRYSNDSPQLRDDVTFLVRSLGGVAYRSDAYELDIRLPDGIEPFRMERKRARYASFGAGRPMRMIDGISPAGEAETVCIQVSAADSLYVTDDFLVTHNTLNGSFIILDEAQNTTPEQMKMFLTRIGFGSKAVITGDVTQVDVPTGRSGLQGLEPILQGIPGLSFVRLTKSDVVRHKIVQDIVEAYERAGEST
jgi:phosphate starvation-inducible PhoH-like protein